MDIYLIAYILYLVIITILGNLLYYKLNDKKNKKYFKYSLTILLIFIIYGFLWLG